MKLTRKIFISLSVVFFATCCGVVLLFDWSVTGWKAYSVPTGSMRPTIRPGSLVLVHSVPVSSLKTGDVITYINLQKPGSTITHRIIKTYKIDGKIPAFITKGDANPSPGQPVVGGLVRGKEVFHMPYLGSLLSWGKGIVGLLVLVYIPAIFVMFEEVRRLSDYYRKMRPYEIADLLPLEKSKKFGKAASSTLLGLVITLAIVGIGTTAQALLRSNTVSLINNRLSVASKQTQCTGNTTTVTETSSGSNNSSNVNVSNSNNQSSSSGNASSSGNTNGGDATSGNATNTNNSCINITVTNH